MGLFDSDKVEEAMLIIGDSLQATNRKWLYVLLFGILLSIPVYFIAKVVSYNLDVSGYRTPAVIGQGQRDPLEIIESGFLHIAGNDYSPYVKIKNDNLDWGIPNFQYRAEVKSADGDILSSVTNTTFILAASEKYILLPRFTADKKPDHIDLTPLQQQFVVKPTNQPELRMDVQRNQITFVNDQTVVNAVVKNASAFTVKQVDLIATIYNERGELVGMAYTNINDLVSGELRSFQLAWPGKLSGQLRAEITPELNIFAKDIIKTQDPVSPFEER
jgi:hypothetical protein